MRGQRHADLRAALLSSLVAEAWVDVAVGGEHIRLLNKVGFVFENIESCAGYNYPYRYACYTKN